MHARTVDSPFSVSFTSVYSPLSFGLRSGIATWMMRLSEIKSAHQGILLKCWMGSLVNWPWGVSVDMIADGLALAY